MGEGGAQIGANQFFGERNANNSGPQHQHIHIVMFDALMSGISVVAHGRPDSWDLVDGNGRTDAAAADQHAALDGRALDGFTDGFRKIGIIVRRVHHEGTDVDNLMAELPEKIRNVLLQWETGVIGANRDAHIEQHNTCAILSFGG